MTRQIFILSLLLFFGIGLYAQPKAVGEPRAIAKTDGEATAQLRAAISISPLLQQMIDDPTGVASEVEALKSFSEYMIFNPVLSPGGDKIVFQVSRGKGMYVCNADGSGLRSLGAKAENATWTPDGKYIVVMSTEDDGHVVTKGELITIDVATGVRTTLLSSSKYIAFDPVISPDGTKLTFENIADGVTYVMDIQ